MGRPKKFTGKGVLEKALPVFWRRGFADASLHELEQATGANKSGLYSEFEDEDIRILEDHQASHQALSEHTRGPAALQIFGMAASAIEST